MSAAATAAPTPPGAPGSESYFDLARKDCVGTARNTTSKVWFTVADGVLSDTYWPTIDATNVHTLQYIVTDGQQLHRSPDAGHDLHGRYRTRRAWLHRGRRPTSAHRYQITTTYIADPARDAVLMHVQFQGPPGDQLYVRLDPLAGGTGGGGSENAGGNTAADRQLGGRRPGRVQHEHDDQRGQPQLRGPDLHGARILRTGFSNASVGYAERRATA